MTVEMLWEQDEPGTVLRDRFGFADEAAAARWVVDALAEGWGVDADGCDRLVMSDRNVLAWVTTTTSADRLVLKWSIAPERFGRLRTAAELARWLADRGLPVSAPLPALDGRVRVLRGGAALVLQRHVDGDLLDVADDEQVHAAGVVLGDLHGALREYPHMTGLVAPDRTLRQQVTGWLAPAPEHVPARGREALDRMVAAAPDDGFPVQLVHGDFRAANVLVVGARISAVLDLEEVRLDHRIGELARSAVMLGTRFHDWGPVPAAVRTRFLDGYESVLPLTADERGWYDVLVLWLSLAFIPPGDDPTGWAAAALEQVDG